MTIDFSINDQAIIELIKDIEKNEHKDKNLLALEAFKDYLERYNESKGLLQHSKKDILAGKQEVEKCIAGKGLDEL